MKTRSMVLLALSLGGCVLDPDIGDRPPPCGRGYVDDGAGRCVEPADIDGGLDPLRDARRDAAPDPRPDSGRETGTAEPDADANIPTTAVRVGTSTELRVALMDARNAGEHRTILLAAGVYPLTETLELDFDVDLLAVERCSAHLEGVGWGRIIRVSNQAVNLSGLTIRDGEAEDHGAGLLVEGEDAAVTLARSCVVGNRAWAPRVTGAPEPTTRGGGIAILPGATLDVYDSDIRDNEALTFGGGLAAHLAEGVTIRRCDISNNRITGDAEERRGGGVDALGTTVTIERSLIADNSEVHIGLQGGGIGVWRSNAVVRDSTVSGNRATFGSAVFQYLDEPTETEEGQTLMLHHVTITGNRSTELNGAAVWRLGGPMAVQDCLFAENRERGGNLVTCRDDTPVPPFVARIVSHGGNVYDVLGGPDRVCGAHSRDVVSRDLRVEPLADNGGSTRTHALPAESPALGAATDCSEPDQTDAARMAPCDSGAFERR